MLFSFFSTQLTAGELDQLLKMDQTSFQVVDDTGDVLLEKDANDPLIPASTIKLLTAFMALETWGREHRFTTEFYLDSGTNLWIRGLGDPLLISEELDKIITELNDRGVDKINNLILDTSFFEKSISIDGQSNSNNPYDAPLGALVANFNTINIEVTSSGITSAEQQTPLTPMATMLGASLGRGTQRINLGSADLGPQYFAELFIAKLQQQDIRTEGEIQFRKVPSGLPRLYQHLNSQTLETVVRGMLKYSTNFSANQLFLLLGVKHNAAPASMKQSEKAMAQFIAREFGWKNHKVIEGAGLSRQNRLSAAQLIDLLLKMRPYADLFPEKETNIIAKTGTLNGTKTYAGYYRRKNSLIPFSLLINQPVSWKFRSKTTQQILKKALRNL